MTAVALHHEATGVADGRPLLLAGSLGTTLAMWEPVLPMLEARLRVVRVDLRGHGGSPVPPAPYAIADLGADVLALMDSLGMERASWCGLSIGGMVGMWLASHAPERIDRLVLVCTAAHLPPASAWAERAAAVREARSAEVVADAVVERWLTPPFAAEHPEIRGWLRGMLAGTDAEGYAGCCGAIERMDLREDLARITAPTLVIGGADDPAAPTEHQRLIADAVADARLEVIGPAAHLASVEQPGAVSRLVLDHLEPA